MNTIPESHHALLADGTRAFAVLGTLMPNGSPQTTPVWFNTEGDLILINSVVGRVKDRNMRANPHIALCIVDPSDPYRYLQLRGIVVEITQLGAEDHIDMLNLKYHGTPRYPRHDPAHPRVIYKIEPRRVSAMG
jgi:PPOX class probable F420-dependent enzyme